MSADSFANAMLPAWEEAMDGFFTRCDNRRRGLGLSDAEVETALGRGYGEDVADAWVEWAGEPA